MNCFRLLAVLILFLQNGPGDSNRYHPYNLDTVSVWPYNHYDYQLKLHVSHKSYLSPKFQTVELHFFSNPVTKIFYIQYRLRPTPKKGWKMGLKYFGN